MEHVLTMANLKLKPSLFTPRPTSHTALILSRVSVYVRDLQTPYAVNK